MRRISIILLLTVLGCSPKLSQPVVELPDKFSYGEHIISSAEITTEWWQGIDDTTLTSLIEEAISNNLTLQSAKRAISQAQYNLRVARSAYLPDLSLDISAERLREVETYESEYEVTPKVSWQIPLFGELRSTSQVARAEIMSAEAKSRAVALSLASEVATAYYSLLEYRAALNISRQSYQLRREATALVDSMYHYGVSSGVDLSQAKAMVAAAEQDVASYTQSVALSEISLAVLLSSSVDSVDFSTITTTLYSLPYPYRVGAGLPSDLIYNRPDLRESYFAIEEAMGRVGVARAAQFPSISLTVDGGLYSTSLKGLTLSKLLTWEWAVELVQPIFNFGRLRANKKALIEEYNATVLNYQQSIISALGDVEKALVSIEQTRLESLYSREYMDNYGYITKATRALYAGGMDDYLSVVDAEREFYAAQIGYLSLLAQQHINYVTLYTALGARVE